MWEEEKFALRIDSDSSHYLFFLGLGLCFWGLKSLSLQAALFRKRLFIILLMSALISFVVGTQAGVATSVFAFGFVIATLASIASATTAVGLTLILYVCRPWEVLKVNDWWAQIPRQCIWLWLVSWLRRLQINPADLSECVRLSKGVGLTLAFGLWCLLTTFVSGDPSGSLQAYLETLFRALTLVMILHLTVRTKEDVESLQTAFVTGVVVLAVFSLWRFHGYDQHAPLDLMPRAAVDAERRLEAVGSLGNSNDIAAVVMIPLGFLLPRIFSKSSGWLERFFSLAVTSVVLRVLFTAQSRGALLAFSAQCALLIVARSNSPKKMSIFLIAVVAAVGSCANQLMGRHAEDLDASTESRMNYYVTGIYMALNSPLWGQGFARYPYEFERFSPATLHEWGLRTAHSSWILVLAETGLIGFLCFVFINIHVARVSWLMRKNGCETLLSFAGYSFTILFLSHSWLMYPWILFTLSDLNNKFSVDCSLRRGGKNDGRK